MASQFEETKQKVSDAKTVGGNTETPTGNPALNWCWTLKEEAMSREALQKVLEEKCSKFKYSLEQGEGGYRHYQGMMCLLRKERLTGIKKWLHISVHLEVCRDERASLAYCEKTESHIDGPWEKGYPKVRERTLKKVPEVWRPWQRSILDIVEGPADERTVHWVFDKDGGKGKTTLARYICVTYGALCIGGKTSDIMFAASEGEADVYVINAARSTEAFAYEAVENLKDGLWFSGKYESKSKVLDYNVHVIVFSNKQPDYGKFTLDRWKVYEIVENELQIV